MLDTILYQGTLAAAVETVYTVPAGQTTRIRNMRFQAIGAGAGYIVKVLLDGTSDANRWHRFTLDANEGMEWAGEMVLRAGQTITIDCDSASAVTLTILGDPGVA
ncbi:MAG: hypothetical protein FJ038_04315 [Chloroflexi bacterium]|nr:hypothetical protein [Chloroflexota bacterium]